MVYGTEPVRNVFHGGNNDSIQGDIHNKTASHSNLARGVEGGNSFGLIGDARRQGHSRHAMGLEESCLGQLQQQGFITVRRNN